MNVIYNQFVVAPCFQLWRALSSWFRSISLIRIHNSWFSYLWLAWHADMTHAPNLVKNAQSWISVKRRMNILDENTVNVTWFTNQGRWRWFDLYRNILWKIKPISLHEPNSFPHKTMWHYFQLIRHVQWELYIASYIDHINDKLGLYVSYSIHLNRKWFPPDALMHVLYSYTAGNAYIDLGCNE